MIRTHDGAPKFKAGDLIMYNREEMRVLFQKGRKLRVKYTGITSRRIRYVFSDQVTKSTWRDKLAVGDFAIYRESLDVPVIVRENCGDTLRVQYVFGRTCFDIHRQSKRLQYTDQRFYPFRRAPGYPVGSIVEFIITCHGFELNCRERVVDSIDDVVITSGDNIVYEPKLIEEPEYKQLVHLPMHVMKTRYKHKTSQYPTRMWNEMIERGDSMLILRDLYNSDPDVVGIDAVIRTMVFESRSEPLASATESIGNIVTQNRIDPVWVNELCHIMTSEQFIYYVHTKSLLSQRRSFIVNIDAQGVNVLWNGYAPYRHILTRAIFPLLEIPTTAEPHYMHDPEPSDSFLYDYQVPVVKRMIELETKSLNFFDIHSLCHPWNPFQQRYTRQFDHKGGFLCCDVGLGKTIEVIALYKQSPKKTIVVAPTTMLTQWEHEARRFLGHEVSVYHGNYKRIGKFTITSYRTLNHNIGDLQGFDRVVFDELHKIRRGTTLNNCRDLDGEFRWSVTATPFPKNRTEDITAQLCILRVNPFVDHPYICIQPIMKQWVMSKLYSRMIFQKRQTLEDLGHIEPIHVIHHHDEAGSGFTFDDPTANEIAHTHPLLVPPVYYGEKNAKQCIDQAIESLNCNESYKTTIKKSLTSDNCAICLEPFETPVLTNCGHIFCKECLEMALKHTHSCPNCRAGVTTQTEIVNKCEAKGYIKKGLYLVSEDTDTRMRKTPHRKKDMLDGKKGIFVSKYKQVVRYLQESLDIPCIVGSMSRRERDRQLQDFKKYGRIAIHAKAAAVGVNMQSAHEVWILDKLTKTQQTQVVGRVKRIGQTKNVHVHHLYTRI